MVESGREEREMTTQKLKTDKSLYYFKHAYRYFKKDDTDKRPVSVQW